jgi:hypothetical protein
MMSCGMGLALWLGVIGTTTIGSSPTPVSCCLRFSTDIFPPRLNELIMGGTCSYPRKRIHGCRLGFDKRRTFLYGTDQNGAIEFYVCYNLPGGPAGLDYACCTFTATGPSTTDPNAPVPEPTALAGTYTCPNGASVPFTLTKQ